MKENTETDKHSFQCPNCGSNDVKNSGRAPQSTKGFGFKCNQCGHAFGTVSKDDLPFRYDFSGES